MGLFSGFRKKKTGNIDARESKREERIQEARHEAQDRVHQGDKGGVEQKTIQPIENSSALAEAVIISPRITEKASDMAADRNAYAFNVAPHATKNQIKQAVKDLYNVTAKKVHIVKLPRTKTRGRRGEQGMTGGGKKAYVYLKRGDSIEFV